MHFSLNTQGSLSTELSWIHDWNIKLRTLQWQFYWGNWNVCNILLNNCVRAQLVWKQLPFWNHQIFVKLLHNLIAIVKFRAIICNIFLFISSPQFVARVSALPVSFYKGKQLLLPQTQYWKIRYLYLSL